MDKHLKEILNRVDEACTTVEAWIEQLEGKDPDLIQHVIDHEHLYYLHGLLNLPMSLRDQLSKAVTLEDE